MKLIYACLSFFFLTGSFFLNNCVAQSYAPRNYHHSDTLDVYWTPNRFKYFQDGYALHRSEVSALMKNYPAAFRYYKKERSRSGWAKVLKIVSGGAMAAAVSRYVAPQYFYPHRFPWIIAATGATLFGISFPIDNASGQYALKAIQTYNRAVNNPNLSSITLEMGQNGPGLALTLSF